MQLAQDAEFGSICQKLVTPAVFLLARLLMGLAGAGVTVMAMSALSVMAAPGPPFVAVAGIMAVGIAAAPLFPLFTLTRPQRLGVQDAPGATQAVSLQVAASAAGSAALPAGIGLVIGAVDARALAPALLVLGVAMCAVYWLLPRPASPQPRARLRRAGR